MTAAAGKDGYTTVPCAVRRRLVRMFHGKAMDQEFHRIKRLPPSVFAEVTALKASARAVRDVKAMFRRVGKAKMPAESWQIAS